MKNKNILYLLIALILIGGWFYWFQIRPSNIRKRCYIEAFMGIKFHEEKETREGRNNLYKQCLVKNGISTSL